jgi:hypothetical protein
MLVSLLTHQTYSAEPNHTSSILWILLGPHFPYLARSILCGGPSYHFHRCHCRPASSAAAQLAAHACRDRWWYFDYWRIYSAIVGYI